MLGWVLSAVAIVSIVAVGVAALAAPRRSAAVYGIVLDDQRALAFIRAMGARDLVIGGLLAIIAFQRRVGALGWGLCLTAVVALVDYVVVTADRRAAPSGARSPCEGHARRSTRWAPSASCSREPASGRLLKFRVFACHDVVSCFSISTDRTPHRASSSAAPRPTGPAPTTITRPASARLPSSGSRSDTFSPCFPARRAPRRCRGGCAGVPPAADRRRGGRAARATTARWSRCAGSRWPT